MDGKVRNGSFLLLFALTLVGFTSPAFGQAPRPEASPIDEQALTTYARAYSQIASTRDEIQAEFARTANKTAEAQADLQMRMRERISEILGEHGLTEEEYGDITFLISVNEEQRQAFAEILGRLEDG